MNGRDVAAAPGRLLSPGANCWRVDRADRFRCVQDAASYFRLVREAMLSARRTIFILGWDISTAVDLLPGATDTRAPTHLGDLLDFLVRRRRDLRCYIVVWDYMALYALERDPFSPLRLKLLPRRVRFTFDDRHPVGASHHQKVVVVDDRLAFVGGIDLTGHRWDTSHHLPNEPLRKTIMGRPYDPYHEVQAMVEGPAAAALGLLARERWRRSAGTRVPPLRPAEESLWPAAEPADLADVDVGIARTEPAFGRRQAVRECAQLFFDSIAAARRSIYIENQYFTSIPLMDALAARLQEPDGPEVIVVVPKECTGWLERQTMGAMRDHALRRLAGADRYGRLRHYYPLASRSSNVATFVHSKVMVIDDQLLRIGSANMSNRSLGLDTECDVVVAADGDDRIAERIEMVRARLLGEHLGVPEAAVLQAARDLGSLRGTIDSLAGRDRTLEAIVVEPPSAAAEPQTTVVDPSEPMLLSREIDRLLPQIEKSERSHRWLLIGPLLLLALILARATSRMSFWPSVHEVREFVASVPPDPELMAYALLGYFVAGLCFVPLHLLTLLSIVIFGLLRGGVLAFVGGVTCALAGYAMGRRLPRRALAWLVGQRTCHLWTLVNRQSAATMAAVRGLALASAASIHILSGAVGVPIRTFLASSLLGLACEILVLGTLGGLLRLSILDPGLPTTTISVGVALAGAFLALRIRARLLRRALEPRIRAREAQSEFG